MGYLNKMEKEFNLSEKMGDNAKVIPTFLVKEFIKFEKARRENQLRIHWMWLKNKPYEEVVKFLNAITGKLAGDELK